VIGPNWLNARDEDGNRRLDNPHDFVRIEIGAALQRNIPVIPILLDGAKVPKANQLPKELEELSLRNGLDVRHVSFHNDVDRLIRGLKGQLAEADAEKRRRDEDERRRQEAEDRRRLDEAEADKRRRDEEQRRPEEKGTRAANKAQRRTQSEEAEALTNKVHEALEGPRSVTGRWPFLASAVAWLMVPGRWRMVAGSATALLLVGWVGLYQVGVPVWVPWVPDPPRADGAKAAAEQQRLKEEEQRQAQAAADAEAKRQAAEAEQVRVKEEEQRQAKAAADAEAKRKAAEAEQQRLAAIKEEEQRQANAADVEAKLKAAEAEQQRLKEEVQRQAKAAADAETKRKAAEAEQQRLKEEVQRQAKAAADAETKRKAAEAEQQRLAAVKAEEERKAKAAAEAEARRKAEEAEQQRLAALRAEQERRAKSPAAGPSPQPVLLGQYGDWGAYTASPGGNKVCFALAKPKTTKTEPAGRKRDQSYVFVSTHPAKRVKNEVSVVMGYPFKTNSDATAEIGTAKFAMYTQNDGAWIKNVAEEARMVDAMRQGAELMVKGTSGSGTQSTDRYSLKGLAQALDKIEQECK
jgi:hypothetical protein